MASAAKTIKGQACPTCHAEGKDGILQYQPGKFAHYCQHGHEFTDSEQLRALLAGLPKPEPPPTAPPPPASQVVIDDENKARLQTILGQAFTDASSLYGAVFALTQQLADARDNQAKAAAAQDRVLGGDLVLSIRIPERHVVPMTDVAISGGLTPEQFMNIRMAEFLDNNWVY